jgi:hypothetical protein
MTERLATRAGAGTPAEEPRPDSGPALRRWFSSLFLPAPASQVTPRHVIQAAVAVAAGAAAGLLRQPGAGAMDTVWAEDGKIFLADATNKSFFRALAESYNGYYQAVPRLLAEPASLLPASWAAGFLAIESALVTALFALIVYVASGAQLRSRLARFVAAAIAVVPAVGMADVPNSLANVHWPGLYALFWILLWVPAGRAGRIVGTVVAILVCATNILAVVFVPLALLRALVRRDRHSIVLTAGVTLGVTVHLLGLALGASSRDTYVSIVMPTRFYLSRVVTANLVGETWLGSIYEPRQHRLTMAALAWCIVAVAVAFALARLTRPNWRVAALAMLHSVLLWLAAAGSTGLYAGRYAAAAGMLLVAALAAVLVPEPGGRLRAAPLVAFATGLAVVCAFNLRVDNLRAQGPRWSTQVRIAQAECARTGAESVDVVITPRVPLWTARLPCSYLQRWG